MGLLKIRYIRGTQRSQRIEALSDGVFAIVMTILVLELAIEGKGSLADELLDMVGSEIFQYFMTFIIIGSFWLVQFYQFRYIDRVDSVLIWLNILFLATVALLPFSYSLLFRGEQELIAMRFYTVNILSSLLLLYIHWEWATHNQRLVDRNIPSDEVRLLKVLMGLNIFSGFLAIGVSFFDYRLSLSVFGVLALMVLGLLVLLGGSFGEPIEEKF